ncbi:hypothetical protein ACLOJK_041441 [Asimina triloba]
MVDAYIERWQKEANRCCAHLSEEEQVQLCRNGIGDDITLLVSEEIKSFAALVKEAYKKECILAQRDERMKREANVVPKAQKKEKGGNSANVAECWTLKKRILKCIKKGVVKTDNNASANNISVASTQEWRQEDARNEEKAHNARGHDNAFLQESEVQRSKEDDGSWDFICPKDIPDVPTSLPRHRNRKHRKELRKKKEQLLKNGLCSNRLTKN